MFGNGFSSLLHGHPARGTLVSFAALASLLHCASLLVFPDQGGVAVPYTACLLYTSNTFATPVLCRPIEWGADIVIHSTTKYMDGHAVQGGGCLLYTSRCV